MPFEQLHIFLIINLCIQSPDIEFKAVDFVFPAAQAEFYSTLKVGPDRPVLTTLHHAVHVADKPTDPIHV
jgi:hypothetical protein